MQSLAQELILRALPLAPLPGQAITIKADAQSDDGVEFVSISAERRGAIVGYSISEDRGAGDVDWEWIGVDYFEFGEADPKPLKFTRDYRPDGSPRETTFEIVIPASEAMRGVVDRPMLMHLKAIMRDASGVEIKREVVFAMGVWPADSMAPVWWRGAGAKTYQIAFIADGADYATGREMLPDLEDLIFGRAYQNDAMRDNRQKVSYWYALATGRIKRDLATGRPVYPEDPFDPPPGFNRYDTAQIQISAWVHRAPMQDQARAYAFSTQTDFPGTFVHEFGHVAFELMDEHCGGLQANSTWRGPNGGLFTRRMPHNNVFDSLNACQNYAGQNGFNPNECRQICPERFWWRLDPRDGQRSMMRNSFHFPSLPQFRRASANRIELLVSVDRVR